VTFREIAFGSEEYRLACRLREEVLRRPLGLSLRDEDLSGEKSQLHFGFFEPDEILVGCVVAVPLSATDVRIRQMAVSPSHRRKGLGRRIMDELEKDLKARGFRHFVLDARTSAVGFYQKLGFTGVGGEFLEVTVPHLRMEKDA
jgi:ribosomal protein S18 acetylase RimI-like enzyme